MKQTFKSNINCSSCINTVSPVLNQELDIESWQVDTEHADKLLTVEGDIEAEKVVSILKNVGYTAELLSEKK